MTRWRSLFESNLAKTIIALNILFSVAMLGALILFVDDVATVLTAYFELGVEEKWQIISKFKFPLVMGGLSLLCFNILALMVCVHHSSKIYNYFDSLVRNIDLMLVEESSNFNNQGFSQQTAALSKKLTQVQNSFNKTQTKQKNEETVTDHSPDNNLTEAS